MVFEKIVKLYEEFYILATGKAAPGGDSMLANFIERGLFESKERLESVARTLRDLKLFDTFFDPTDEISVPSAE